MAGTLIPTRQQVAAAALDTVNTALDTANTANTTANTALNTANTALSAANAVGTTASAATRVTNVQVGTVLPQVSTNLATAYKMDMKVAASSRLATFSVLGKYVNELTTAVATLTNATGFGYSFGTATTVTAGVAGTAIGAGLNFGYSFGQAAVIGTSKNVNVAKRGPAAWSFFGQI